MFKISRLTDYATGILCLMAAAPKNVHTARDITARTAINLPTVMKVLKLLTKAGLLTSQRGPNGGYQLAKAPDTMTLLDIIETIEGDVGLTECSLKDRNCHLESICETRHNWQTISHLLYDALGQITLAQMSRPLASKSFQIELAGKSFSAAIEDRDTGETQHGN